MATTTAVAARRVGRPCGVCSLPAATREWVEESLAEGSSISSVSRQLGLRPGRESIANHIKGGHLRADLEERVLRHQGLDTVSIVGRITEIAQGHRQTVLEAEETGNGALAIRARDAELRALGALAAAGFDTERDAQAQVLTRRIANAAVTVAKTDSAVADALLLALDAAGHPDVADLLAIELSANEMGTP